MTLDTDGTTKRIFSSNLNPHHFTQEKNTPAIPGEKVCFHYGPDNTFSTYS